MSETKTAEKYERQTRYKENKAKSGQRQISLWLDEETIKQLTELAEGSSRAAIVTDSIHERYEDKKKAATLDKGKKTYGKDSDYGMYG